jgi:hypothetical protein
VPSAPFTWSDGKLSLTASLFNAVVPAATRNDSPNTIQRLWTLMAFFVFTLSGADGAVLDNVRLLLFAHAEELPR